jgi:hypothetical protein
LVFFSLFLVVRRSGGEGGRRRHDRLDGHGNLDDEPLFRATRSGDGGRRAAAHPHGTGDILQHRELAS